MSAPTWWDPKITLGNILSTIVMCGAVMSAYMRINDRLTAIEVKLDPLWKEFERRRIAR